MCGKERACTSETQDGFNRLLRHVSGDQFQDGSDLGGPSLSGSGCEAGSPPSGEVLL